jgi:hypothetical protein
VIKFEENPEEIVVVIKVHKKSPNAKPVVGRQDEVKLYISPVLHFPEENSADKVFTNVRDF